MADTTFKLNRAGSVALVTIDNGEDYHVPTTLGRSAFASAVAVLDELERGDWSAAVFTGKPFVFCVGADIDEFEGIEDPREGIRAGHESGTYTVPLPAGAISGKRVCLLVSLRANGAARAPTTKEVKRVRVAIQK